MGSQSWFVWIPMYETSPVQSAIWASMPKSNVDRWTPKFLQGKKQRYWFWMVVVLLNIHSKTSVQGEIAFFHVNNIVFVHFQLLQVKSNEYPFFNSEIPWISIIVHMQSHFVSCVPIFFGILICRSHNFRYKMHIQYTIWLWLTVCELENPENKWRSF